MSKICYGVNNIEVDDVLVLINDFESSTVKSEINNSFDIEELYAITNINSYIKEEGKYVYFVNNIMRDINSPVSKSYRILEDLKDLINTSPNLILSFSLLNNVGFIIGSREEFVDSYSRAANASIDINNITRQGVEKLIYLSTIKNIPLKFLYEDGQYNYVAEELLYFGGFDIKHLKDVDNVYFIERDIYIEDRKEKTIFGDRSYSVYNVKENIREVKKEELIKDKRYEGLYGYVFKTKDGKLNIALFGDTRVTSISNGEESTYVFTNKGIASVDEVPNNATSIAYKVLNLDTPLSTTNKKVKSLLSGQPISLSKSDFIDLPKYLERKKRKDLEQLEKISDINKKIKEVEEIKKNMSLYEGVYSIFYLQELLEKIKDAIKDNDDLNDLIELIDEYLDIIKERMSSVQSIEELLKFRGDVTKIMIKLINDIAYKKHIGFLELIIKHKLSSISNNDITDGIDASLKVIENETLKTILQRVRNNIELFGPTYNDDESIDNDDTINADLEFSDVDEDKITNGDAYSINEEEYMFDEESDFLVRMIFNSSGRKTISDLILYMQKASLTLPKHFESKDKRDDRLYLELSKEFHRLFMMSYDRLTNDEKAEAYNFAIFNFYSLTDISLFSTVRMDNIFANSLISVIGKLTKLDYVNILMNAKTYNVMFSFADSFAEDDKYGNYIATNGVALRGFAYMSSIFPILELYKKNPENSDLLTIAGDILANLIIENDPSIQKDKAYTLGFSMITGQYEEIYNIYRSSIHYLNSYIKELTSDTIIGNIKKNLIKTLPLFIDYYHLDYIEIDGKSEVRDTLDNIGQIIDEIVEKSKNIKELFKELEKSKDISALIDVNSVIYNNYKRSLLTLQEYNKDDIKFIIKYSFLNGIILLYNNGRGEVDTRHLSIFSKAYSRAIQRVEEDTSQNLYITPAKMSVLDVEERPTEIVLPSSTGIGAQTLIQALNSDLIDVKDANLRLMLISSKETSYDINKLELRNIVYFPNNDVTEEEYREAEKQIKKKLDEWDKAFMEMYDIEIGVIKKKIKDGDTRYGKLTLDTYKNRHKSFRGVFSNIDTGDSFASNSLLARQLSSVVKGILGRSKDIASVTNDVMNNLRKLFTIQAIENSDVSVVFDTAFSELYFAGHDPIANFAIQYSKYKAIKDGKELYVARLTRFGPSDDTKGIEWFKYDPKNKEFVKIPGIPNFANKKISLHFASRLMNSDTVNQVVDDILANLSIAIDEFLSKNIFRIELSKKDKTLSATETVEEIIEEYGIALYGDNITLIKSPHFNNRLHRSVYVLKSISTRLQEMIDLNKKTTSFKAENQNKIVMKNNMSNNVESSNYDSDGRPVVSGLGSELKANGYKFVLLNISEVAENMSDNIVTSIKLLGYGVTLNDISSGLKKTAMIPLVSRSNKLSFVENMMELKTSPNAVYGFGSIMYRILSQPMDYRVMNYGDNYYLADDDVFYRPFSIINDINKSLRVNLKPIDAIYRFTFYDRKLRMDMYYNLTSSYTKELNDLLRESSGVQINNWLLSAASGKHETFKYTKSLLSFMENGDEVIKDLEKASEHINNYVIFNVIKNHLFKRIAGRFKSENFKLILDQLLKDEKFEEGNILVSLARNINDIKNEDEKRNAIDDLSVLITDLYQNYQNEFTMYFNIGYDYFLQHIFLNKGNVSEFDIRSTALKSRSELYELIKFILGVSNLGTTHAAERFDEINKILEFIYTNPPRFKMEFDKSTFRISITYNDFTIKSPFIKKKTEDVISLEDVENLHIFLVALKKHIKKFAALGGVVDMYNKNASNITSDFHKKSKLDILEDIIKKNESSFQDIDIDLLKHIVNIFTGDTKDPLNINDLSVNQLSVLSLVSIPDTGIDSRYDRILKDEIDPRSIFYLKNKNMYIFSDATPIWNDINAYTFYGHTALLYYSNIIDAKNQTLSILDDAFDLYLNKFREKIAEDFDNFYTTNERIQGFTDFIREYFGNNSYRNFDDITGTFFYERYKLHKTLKLISPIYSLFYRSTNSLYLPSMVFRPLGLSFKIINKQYSDQRDEAKRADEKTKLLRAFVESMVLSDAVRVYTNIFINDEHEFKSKDNEKRNSLSTKVIFSDTLTNVLLGDEGQSWYINNRQFRMITANEPLTNILTDINKVYANFLKNIGKYDEIEAFNGHGYIPLEVYRALAIQSREWNPKKELIYNKIIKGETISVDDIADIMKGLTIFKIHYGGPLLNSSISEKSQDKFALLPIHPNMFKDVFIGDGSKESNIFNELYQFMKENGIHYINFESGSKQALIKNSKKENNDLLVKRGKVYHFNNDLKETLRSNISVKNIFYLGLNTYNGKEQKTKIMLNVKYPVFLELGKLTLIERVINDIDMGTDIELLLKLDIYSDIYESVKLANPSLSEDKVHEIVRETLLKNKEDIEAFILNMDEFRRLALMVTKKLTNIDIEGFTEKDLDKILSDLFDSVFSDISDEHKEFVQIMKNDIKLLGLNESMIPLIRQKLLGLLKKVTREPKYMTGNMPIQSVYIPDKYDIGEYNIRIEKLKRASSVLDRKIYNRVHYSGRIILPLKNNKKLPKQVTIDGKIYDVVGIEEKTKRQIKNEAEELGLDERTYIKGFAIDYNFYTNVSDDFKLKIVSFKGNEEYNTFTADVYIYKTRADVERNIDEILNAKGVVKVGVYDTKDNNNKLIIIDNEEKIIYTEIDIKNDPIFKDLFTGYKIFNGSFYNQTGLGYSITKEYKDVLPLLPGSLLLFNGKVKMPVLSDGTIIHSTNNDGELNGFLYLLKYIILNNEEIKSSLLDKNNRIDKKKIKELIEMLNKDDKEYALVIGSGADKIKVNGLIVTSKKTNTVKDETDEYIGLMEKAVNLGVSVNEKIEPDEYSIVFVKVKDNTNEKDLEEVLKQILKVINNGGSIVVERDSIIAHKLGKADGMIGDSYLYYNKNPYSIYEEYNKVSEEYRKSFEEDVLLVMNKVFDRYSEAVKEIKRNSTLNESQKKKEIARLSKDLASIKRLLNNVNEITIDDIKKISVSLMIPEFLVFVAKYSEDFHFSFNVEKSPTNEEYITMNTKNLLSLLKLKSLHKIKPNSPINSKLVPELYVEEQESEVAIVEHPEALKSFDILDIPLLFYRTPDGKIIGDDISKLNFAIMLYRLYRFYQNTYGSINKDNIGEYISELKRLMLNYSYSRDGKIETTKESIYLVIGDQRMLLTDWIIAGRQLYEISSKVVFRVPLQTSSSIDVIRVKQYIPSLNEIIFSSTTLTALMGADHDNDKLNTLSYSYLLKIPIDIANKLKITDISFKSKTDEQYVYVDIIRLLEYNKKTLSYLIKNDADVELIFINDDVFNDLIIEREEDLLLIKRHLSTNKNIASTKALKSTPSSANIMPVNEPKTSYIVDKSSNFNNTSSAFKFFVNTLMRSTGQLVGKVVYSQQYISLMKDFNLMNVFALSDFITYAVDSTKDDTGGYIYHMMGGPYLSVLFDIYDETTKSVESFERYIESLNVIFSNYDDFEKAFNYNRDIIESVKNEFDEIFNEYKKLKRREDKEYFVNSLKWSSNKSIKFYHIISLSYLMLYKDLESVLIPTLLSKNVRNAEQRINNYDLINIIREHLQKDLKINIEETGKKVSKYTEEDPHKSLIDIYDVLNKVYNDNTTLENFVRIKNYLAFKYFVHQLDRAYAYTTAIMSTTTYQKRKISMDSDFAFVPSVSNFGLLTMQTLLRQIYDLHNVYNNAGDYSRIIRTIASINGFSSNNYMRLISYKDGNFIFEGIDKYIDVLDGKEKPKVFETFTNYMIKKDGKYHLPLDVVSFNYQSFLQFVKILVLLEGIRTLLELKEELINVRNKEDILKIINQTLSKIYKNPSMAYLTKEEFLDKKYNDLNIYPIIEMTNFRLKEAYSHLFNGLIDIVVYGYNLQDKEIIDSYIKVKEASSLFLQNAIIDNAFMGDTKEDKYITKSISQALNRLYESIEMFDRENSLGGKLSNLFFGLKHHFANETLNFILLSDKQRDLPVNLSTEFKLVAEKLSNTIFLLKDIEEKAFKLKTALNKKNIVNGLFKYITPEKDKSLFVLNTQDYVLKSLLDIVSFGDLKKKEKSEAIPFVVTNTMLNNLSKSVVYLFPQLMKSIEQLDYTEFFIELFNGVLNNDISSVKEMYSYDLEIKTADGKSIYLNKDKPEVFIKAFMEFLSEPLNILNSSKIDVYNRYKNFFDQHQLVKQRKKESKDEDYDIYDDIYGEKTILEEMYESARSFISRFMSKGVSQEEINKQVEKEPSVKFYYLVLKLIYKHFYNNIILIRGEDVAPTIVELESIISYAILTNKINLSNIPDVITISDKNYNIKEMLFMTLLQYIYNKLEEEGGRKIKSVDKNIYNHFINLIVSRNLSNKNLLEPSDSISVNNFKYRIKEAKYEVAKGNVDYVSIVNEIEEFIKQMNVSEEINIEDVVDSIISSKSRNFITINGGFINSLKEAYRQIDKSQVFSPDVKEMIKNKIFKDFNIRLRTDIKSTIILSSLTNTANQDGTDVIVFDDTINELCNLITDENIDITQKVNTTLYILNTIFSNKGKEIRAEELMYMLVLNKKNVHLKLTLEQIFKYYSIDISGFETKYDEIVVYSDEAKNNLKNLLNVFLRQFDYEIVLDEEKNILNLQRLDNKQILNC
jgi:hypothetical protein